MTFVMNASRAAAPVMPQRAPTLVIPPPIHCHFERLFTVIPTEAEESETVVQGPGRPLPSPVFFAPIGLPVESRSCRAYSPPPRPLGRPQETPVRGVLADRGWRLIRARFHLGPRSESGKTRLGLGTGSESGKTKGWPWVPVPDRSPARRHFAGKTIGLDPGLHICVTLSEVEESPVVGSGRCGVASGRFFGWAQSL